MSARLLFAAARTVMHYPLSNEGGRKSALCALPPGVSARATSMLCTSGTDLGTVHDWLGSVRLARECRKRGLTSNGQRSQRTFLAAEGM